MADILPRQKIVQQLVKISRQIPQDSSLPRIHYLLEPLLTGGEAEPDDLISIHETLERIFGDEESLSHLYWSLKSTSNESIAEKYLKDIYPSSPLSDDWNPDDPRVLLRFLITRIDMCPQFSSRDPSLYENYVSFIVQVYPELGHSGSFPHNDYAKRLNLYRLMEEKGFITPKSIEALTDILERLELKKLKAEIEEEFSLLLRDVDSLQLKKTLRYIQSKMHRKSTLPRVYYILESLLTEEVKRDSLLSMYQSLQMRDLNGTSPLWYLLWVLKVTQNERLANEYLRPLIPDPPPPPDWSPTIPPLLLRMIIVSIDASEALRDPKVFKSFVRSVSACDEYIGSLSNYPHDRVDLRMDLYRRLEERSVISMSNIEPLISILDSLGLKALQEKVVESFKRHLKGLSYKATVKKAIDAVVSELNCPRVLPRVYYLLECLLTEDAKSDDLYSLYISLSKRDLKDQDPLWYIAWSLSHTHNDALVRDHIHPLLVDNPVPDKWMPPNPMMMMRVVMVRMDLSEEFRKKETYINFIRVISPHDEYIGIHKAFPFDQQMERMNFYRRLENVKLITPEKIMVIIDGLRYIGEIGLMDRVSQDFRRLLFSHRQVTPTGYYSAAQLAHFDPSSPLYSMYSLDPALPPKEPPSLPPPPLTGGGTAPTSNGQLASSQRGIVPGGQQMPHPLRVTGATPLQREGGAGVVPPRNDPPDYKSVVDEYRYHPPTTPDTMTGKCSCIYYYFMLLSMNIAAIKALNFVSHYYYYYRAVPTPVGPSYS